jgi:hypothetical protein
VVGSAVIHPAIQDSVFYQFFDLVRFTDFLGYESLGFSKQTFEFNSRGMEWGNRLERFFPKSNIRDAPVVRQ